MAAYLRVKSLQVAVFYGTRSKRTLAPVKGSVSQILSKVNIAFLVI